MKRFYILACSFIAALMMDSCSKEFLTVDSPNKLYVSDYYTTQDRIFEGLVAAYDPLQWFDYSWGQFDHLGFVSDAMSDDVYVGGSDQNDCIYLHRISNYSALPTSTVSDLWTAFYSGVNRANNVLQNMPNVKVIADADKALYLAEAKVLRSYYYTWLWKLWGNIPYYETNLTFPYIHEQNTADQVYTGIITTLEDAIKNGGLPMKATDATDGRVTLAMAYMLYTEVVMYQKDESRYATALNYMEQIIKSGNYALATDFAGIWEEAGEWSKESIYEINYFNKNGKRDWGSALADGGSVYPKLIGINGLSGSSEFAGGWGFEPVKAATYAMYDENDTRRDGGILNMDKYSKATGAKYSPRYEDEGNFLKKYLPRANGNANCSASPDMNYGNNFRVYRYSETLLYAAELLARGVSGTGSAQSYLDQVRSRAHVGSIPATVDNILQERRLEFVGEGKRYWDLIRSGQAASVLVAGGKYRTVSWTENKKYLPIPQSEIDAAAGTLKQNPY